MAEFKAVVSTLMLASLIGGCAFDDTKPALYAKPVSLKPFGYARISSVVNRLKCDVLLELEKHKPGSDWMPVAISGTLGLSVVKDASTAAEGGFSIPISPVTIGVTGSSTETTENTRKVEINFEFVLDSKAGGPRICTARPAVEAVKDKTNQTLTMEEKPLVEFLDMAQAVNGIKHLPPMIRINKVAYEGGFAFKSEGKVEGGLDFVVVKLGNISHSRSTAYDQTYSMEVTYKGVVQLAPPG